jgi:ABC-2 type transport system ATP-binding protein
MWVMHIINLDNIVFAYGDVPVINRVSLTLEGGVYGLLGPNGAGKTTMMKILLGFLTPQIGRGRVLGFDIGRQRRDLRRLIGYMPESDCLIPRMDAVSLTAYMGQLSGMPKQEAIKRAHDVLFYVGLDEARYRLVDSYSTGMKQKLKLAQALVHDPRLLLLDEPTSGMDPSGRKELLDLIRDIARKESMNIIISTHLLPDIEYACEHVLIMNKGEIVAQQPIAGVGRETFNSYELKLKGDESAFMGRLRALQVQVSESANGSFKILIPGTTGTAALFRAAADSGVQIRQLKPSKTSLEDTFMQAIGETNGY